MDFQFKDRYDFEDVLKIMKILRSDDGCPWDRVQTHKSIRDNFIEETYEAVDAIDKEDPVLLKEELGDVLMQVVFHSQMSESEGSFTFDDVCDGLVKKLVQRHPHVFADKEAGNEKEALASWEDAKREIKKQKLHSDSIDDVPKCLPSLIRAQKVQKRAAKSGMDFRDINGVLDRIGEELEELKTAVYENDVKGKHEEIGDLLFSVVNAARFLDIGSEHALYDSTEKFAKRFRAVEQICSERGIDMKTCDESLADSLWEAVKNNE